MIHIFRFEFVRNFVSSMILKIILQKKSILKFFFSFFFHETILLKIYLFNYHIFIIYLFNNRIENSFQYSKIKLRYESIFNKLIENYVEEILNF